MKRVKTTILVDFLFVVIAVVIISMSISTYFNIMTHKRSAVSELDHISNILVSSLKSSAETGIRWDDTKIFDKIIKEVKGDSENKKGNIKEINLYRFFEKSPQKMKLIYSTDKAKKVNSVIKNKSLLEIKEKLEKKNTISYPSKHKNEVTYDYITGIKYNGKLIGTLNIYYSVKNIKKANAKIFSVNILTTIFSLIVIIALTTFLLLVRIYNPITKLIKEVRKIKEGQISYHVDLKVNNELKELADEVEQMKDKLWHSKFDDRFVNPVTGLPGLIKSLEVINENMEKEKPFNILSIGLRNSEPYVLKYGLSHGEDVLRFVVQILQEAIEEKKIESASLSQIRDTHFLIIFDEKQEEELAELITEKFDERVSALYREEDADGMKIGGKNYNPLSAIVTIIKSDEEEELKTYKEIEEKILQTEQKYYNKDKNSIYVVHSSVEDDEEKEEIEDDEELEDEIIEESIEDDEEDLLAGLDEL